MAKKPQNKAFAIRYLKQAKAKEAQTQKLEGFTENLSSQLDALELAEFSKLQVSALTVGKNALSGQIDVDNALDVVDETVDLMEKTTELSDALSKPMGGVQHDEEELLAELEAMQNEGEISVEEIGAGLTTISTGPVLGTDLPSVSNIAPLPAVPKATPQATTEAEEADLAAWLQ